MWELEICNANGTTRSRITPEDPVHSLVWQSRGDGDCLEAEIMGRGLDIRPRDIVIIRARTNATDPNPPSIRYIGWVVETPSPRDTGIAASRLIGGRKRLEEILNRTLRTGATPIDVADAARGALVWVQGDNATTPRIAVPPFSGAGRIPALGFNSGDRYPQLETVSESLEAYATMVPGFTVLPGSTYSYNGHTYNPGDVVPPTKWGVKADAGDGGRGLIFFQRPNPTPANLDEIADGLDITWRPRSAEEVVDDVTVVVAETHNADAAAAINELDEQSPYYAGPIAPPVTYRLQAPGSTYGAQIRVGADGQGLKPASWDLPGTGLRFDNIARAFDNNVASYAANNGTGECWIARGALPKSMYFRVRYSSHVPILATIHRDNLAGVQTRHVWNLPSTKGMQAERYLQAPWWTHTESAVSAIRLEVQADAADVTRIYEITAYEPDPAVLEQVARSHLRLPGSTPAATVQVPNQLLPPSWFWQIDLADSDTLQGTAELVEYRIDTEGGMTTVLHLEQALSGRETATRALLDYRIRSAVRQGTRPQP